MGPQSIACQHEHVAALVPYGDSKIPVKFFGSIFPKLLVCIHDHFSIRTCPKSISALLQILTQFPVIVDFTVLYNKYGSFLITQRLVPTCQINYAKTPTAQSDIW